MEPREPALLKRIVTDPQVCHGAPCIRGTRIHIDVILDALAEGQTEEEILADYPRLTHQDVAAVLTYAAKAFQPT
jgi:uncharacterized protein (DUF433 family)